MTSVAPAMLSMWFTHPSGNPGTCAGDGSAAESNANQRVSPISGSLNLTVNVEPCSTAPVLSIENGLV
jgi:hypothetical protein